jgi:hypothetical protein
MALSRYSHRRYNASSLFDVFTTAVQVVVDCNKNLFYPIIGLTYVPA